MPPAPRSPVPSHTPSSGPSPGLPPAQPGAGTAPAAPTFAQTSAPVAQWPRPPACLPAAWLDRPPATARVTVAGLVILRQRPGTAKGVIFLTLEDETGIVNIIVWRKIYEAFRRAVIAGRLLRVTGQLQRSDGVTHVIAERVEDISSMLDLLLAEQGRSGDPAFAPPADMG